MRFVIFSSGMMLNLDAIVQIKRIKDDGEYRVRFYDHYFDLMLTEAETVELERYIQEYGISNGFTKL